MTLDYSWHEETYRQLEQAGMPGRESVDHFNRTIITIEKVMRNAYVPSSGRLLELGCGAGNITLWLAARGYDAYGIDVSPTAIRIAKQTAYSRNVKANFSVQNITEQLDFTKDFFDVILDGNMLHCIVGEDRRQALLNIRTVLRSGGFFHVGTMCGKVHGKYFRDSFDPQSRCVKTGSGDILRYVGCADEILDEIKKAGFYILNWKIHPINNFGNDNEYLEVDTIKP